ncbi:MAG TPA: MarR family transcriptional regulator [Marmoricola sp.]|jgi:DNA-binding MarR family transcriptional regulator|nr:MarR family transcriptional regulator [Marmoricola sp.]
MAGTTSAPAQVAEELYALMTVVLHSVPRDLSLTALSTLAGVERTGPRRITDLAQSEGVTQPSMTTLVSNLERAGYLERRREQSDGRVALVAITMAGSALLAQRRHAGAEALDRLIDQLDEDQASALRAAAPAIAGLRGLDEVRRDTLAVRD